MSSQFPAQVTVTPLSRSDLLWSNYSTLLLAILKSRPQSSPTHSAQYEAGHGEHARNVLCYGENLWSDPRENSRGKTLLDVSRVDGKDSVESGALHWPHLQISD